MNAPKSAKIAAAFSQAFFILWILLTAFSLIYQDQILSTSYFNISPNILEDTEKVLLYSVAAQFITGVVITGANVMIFSGKGAILSLVTAAAAAVTLPVISKLLHFVQTREMAMRGSDYLVRMGTTYLLSENILYFLYISVVITAAAAAVFVYSKKARSAIPESEKNNL